MACESPRLARSHVLSLRRKTIRSLYEGLARTVSLFTECTLRHWPVWVEWRSLDGVGPCEEMAVVLRRVGQRGAGGFSFDLTVCACHTGTEGGPCVDLQSGVDVP